MIARTLIQSRAVSAWHDSTEKAHAWFLDAYRALEWMVSSNCHNLHQQGAKKIKDGKYIYRQSADAKAKTRPIRLIYEYDDDHVIIYQASIV